MRTPILGLAVFVTLLFFLWEGNEGLNLWDEGFLWYGVQRVMLGEVPIRDFMAYDPGRYYWSAAFMSLWSDHGILALRISEAIFQVIGLWIALWLLARTVTRQNVLYLFLSAVILALWMLPLYKQYDVSISILLIGALAFLIEQPTSARYYLAGLCIGLAAVFGRNHGIYGFVGGIGVMIWLNIRRTECPRFGRGGLFFIAGVVTGFLPMLWMFLFVPGFLSRFWESIRLMFDMGSANIPIPIPWPWRVEFSAMPIGAAIRGVLFGLFFVALVVFGIFSIAWVSWRRFRKQPTSPTLVATAFLALPYAHYAYSRADTVHLAMGIFPLLIGCLAIVGKQSARVREFALLGLYSSSFLTCWVPDDCVVI